jgi:hypothetical protein
MREMMMKHTLLFCILVCWPLVAHGQDTINPFNIGQPMTIILQNTDVYYRPMKPPDSAHDTREGLSNQGARLLDSNGVGNWGVYLPQKYDSASGHLVNLKDWSPYGTPLGPTGYWQRLFTAQDNPSGGHSDIIAGDSVTDSIAHGGVTIDSLEDVDFRASGEIRLEDGFHVMPGAFFHAYIEPTWGAPVLSDEFDSTALDGSKWYVTNGANTSYGIGPVCSYDSNVTIDTDYQATDGHALDIALRYHTDSATAFGQNENYDSCGESTNISDSSKFLFSTGILHACPFPFTSRGELGDTVGPPLYQHAPYGRYEIREKIPHIPQHSNAMWCWDNFFEFDNEMFGSADVEAGQYHTTIYRPLLYGPFKGVFAIGTDTEFKSNAPKWRSQTNNPNLLVIKNFPYQVRMKDSVTLVADGDMTYKLWPSSLLSGDSLTFYYARNALDTADVLPWKLSQDSAMNWRILDMGYRDSLGDTVRFSKTYQPISVTLTSGLFGSQHTFECYWDSVLSTDSGRAMLYLRYNEDAILDTNVHSNTEAYTYLADEGMHYHYSEPPVQFGPPYDSVGTYQYHTFTFELLPNEAEFLLDGNVVRRYPDRLIPPTDKHADWITTLPRFTPEVDFGQMTLDGLDSTEIAWLITHVDTTSTPGCWPVQVPPGTGPWYPAAHTLIDYVKIYDIPDDVKVSRFPN